jgi:hypothetical protein
MFKLTSIDAVFDADSKYDNCFAQKLTFHGENRKLRAEFHIFRPKFGENGFFLATKQQREKSYAYFFSPSNGRSNGV